MKPEDMHRYKAELGKDVNSTRWYHVSVSATQGNTICDEQQQSLLQFNSIQFIYRSQEHQLFFPKSQILH